MDKEYTSKELSQRLHDKGFRTEHRWAWYNDENQWWVDYKDLALPSDCTRFPAYTFTELWAVVPKMIQDKYIFALYKQFTTGMAVCQYDFYGEHDILNGSRFEHASPAEALGLLVEWLI